MRGLATLAIAFELPSDLPQRHMTVLAAFAVVLATLIVQSLTLAPLVRLLKLYGEDGLGQEFADARADLASTALKTIQGKKGQPADFWRYEFETSLAAASQGDSKALEEQRRFGLTALRAQRERLQALRTDGRVGGDAFLVLQEELDFAEVTLTPERERHIEES
jgi:CPA1 family monovalent cation:H+ antiporter